MNLGLGGGFLVVLGAGKFLMSLEGFLKDPRELKIDGEE